MTNAIIVDINLLSLYTINFGFVVYDYLLDEYLNYLIRQFIYLCVFLNQLYQIRCIETGPIIKFERDIGLSTKTLLISFNHKLSPLSNFASTRILRQ